MSKGLKAGRNVQMKQSQTQEQGKQSRMALDLQQGIAQCVKADEYYISDEAVRNWHTLNSESEQIRTCWGLKKTKNKTKQKQNKTKKQNLLLC